MKLIVDAINRRLEQTGRKLDANQTAFISQELTQILSKVLEVQYPELRGRTFVPLNTFMSPGTEFFKTKVYDQVGMADVITSATTDLNELNIVAKEIVQQVLEVGAVYSWTVAELEAAAFSNTPLDMLNVKMARRQIETAIDSIIATGGTRETPSSKTGQTGLLNNPYVPSFTFAAQPWSDSVASDVILSELNTWANSVTVNSKTVFSATRMILSPYWFNYLATRPYSAMVPDSILKVFVDNSPSIKSVDQWYYCTDFVSDGYDIGVVYQDSDDVLTFGNPVPFQEQAPQFINLKVQVPVRATVVPTVVYQPLGVSYATFQNPA